MTRIGLGSVIVAGLVFLVAGSVQIGCTDPCCTMDEYPIDLQTPLPGPAAGGLRALAQSPNTPGTFNLSIDTGSPLTFFPGRPSGTPSVEQRDFDILDARSVQGTFPVRASLRHIPVLPVLDPTTPDAVLGGDFLRNFSIQVTFGASSPGAPALSFPSLTFWSRQGASDDLLANAGFAVLHFDLLGGGELTATSTPDFLGLTGPVEMPATRMVLRACGGPAAFDFESPTAQMCCKRGDEGANATGADLALVVATGLGPLVLSESAWQRILARLAATSPATPPPTPVDGPATLPIPGLSAPIAVDRWSTLPRLAVVNQETDASTDPGACVELGRSRRLEWIEHHAGTACVQPCDTDARSPSLAQNAAAYTEIGGDIPVAILLDSTPLLQGLRAEIRPVGPEIDGLLGANVFAQTSLEIDYRSKPPRALLACTAANSSVCWTSPRCPRLANQGDTRACFGQIPRTTLPPVCDATQGCG